MAADGDTASSTPNKPSSFGASGRLAALGVRAGGVGRDLFAEFGRAWVWFVQLLLRANIIFSLKTFAAAMLALFISMALDLSQPGWAAVTVYIVSQPLAGMVLSKSLARITGTIIGAFMAVVFVSVFYDARELFVLVSAGWIGACLYVSIMLREAPSAYGAMLAGYTAAMVGFPAVLAPATVFDTAWTRCIEILLGITIATVVSRVVFPQSTARVFQLRVTVVLGDMRQCIISTLRNHHADALGLAALRKLIGDAIALESLRIHASHDTHDSVLQGNLVRALQGRMLSLSSLLVSIHDRMAALRREHPSEAVAFESLLERVVGRVDVVASGARLAGAGRSLTGDLLAQLPDFEAMRREPGLVVKYNLVLRLVDMLAQWQEVNRLQALLFASGVEARVRAANVPVPPAEDTRIKQYRDHTLAIVSSAGVFTAIVLTSIFWIYTGWANGSSAAMFAGVISCIVAVQDNPTRAALGQLYGTTGSVICAAVLLFALLPVAGGFGWLATSIGLLLLPLGTLSIVPRIAYISAPLAINIIAFSSLKNVMSPDFADFINGNVALLAGIGAGVLGFRLFRPVSADWPVRRLTSGMMRDLAQLSASEDPELRSHFESRMLDRINAITGRLRMDSETDREHFRGTLTVLRVGLNNLALLQALPSMPPRLAASVRVALGALSTHARQLARTRASESGRAAGPLLQFDAAISAALDAGPESHADALNTLVSLRAISSTLSGHARFYGIRGGSDIS